VQQFSVSGKLQADSYVHQLHLHYCKCVTTLIYKAIAIGKVNNWLVGWCLTVLSTQKGYIVPCEN